jgi:cell division protein YceG involved in septum cleavage
MAAEPLDMPTESHEIPPPPIEEGLVPPEAALPVEEQPEPAPVETPLDAVPEPRLDSARTPADEAPEPPLDPAVPPAPGSQPPEPLDPVATPAMGSHRSAPRADPVVRPVPELHPPALLAPRQRPRLRRRAGGSPRAPRTTSRRSTPAARIGALIALLAVAAAIVLLVYSLARSGHTKPPPPGPVVVKVLIPEGKTRAQIAEIAKAEGLTGSYSDSSRSSPLLNPAIYGAPHGTADLEGFLFPATYDMDKGAPASRLVAEQLEAFSENFGPHDVAAAHHLGVTPYGLLTVASMVEREAQVPGDRAKIAAVIYNRLKAGIPLGIDASIYYAVEQQKGIATYTKELTESELHIDSPYNTRTHVGLPPTPISNPGVASIEAAAHPAHVSYLYYVAGADGCGEQVFSNTQAQFEVNVAAYQAAKEKNGGHPPKCKHG